MKLLWIYFLLAILAFAHVSHGAHYVPPTKLSTSSTLYQLFSERLREDWGKLRLGAIGGNNYSVLLDPIPVFDLNVSCYSMRVIAVPLEGAIARDDQGKLATDKTWINSDGSRILVYGVDFKEQKFHLLYDGLLVNLYGAESDKSVCPDLIGLAVEGRGQHRRLSSIRLRYSPNLKTFRKK